jgi:purine nucleosidase
MEQNISRVIIDTDLGIDDAGALILALMSPEITIEGITSTFGNTIVENCTRNTLHVLELLDMTHIPVRQGAARPIMLDRRDLGGHVHGSGGLGDYVVPPLQTTTADGNAIQWMIETIMASPGEIDVLLFGPQTNLSLALSIEPELGKAIRRIVFMGGTIKLPGNVTPVATANIAYDPEAAKIVMKSAGCPIIMHGQDVTHFVRVTPAHAERLKAADTKVTRFLGEIQAFYGGHYAREEPVSNGFPIHDMNVVAYVLDPSLYTTQKLFLDVETAGAITRAQIVADFRQGSPDTPQVDVCLEVDAEGVMDLFLERVTRSVG